MKKFVVIAISALLVCSLVLPAMASAFPDVPENHWAYKAVEELYAAGLIIGYPDGTFGGQRSMTRYEYAMIVSRLLDRLEEIAAEGELKANQALDAAETAKDMALKAQLAADAAANAKPVERIIEKHFIETKPDIPYEEIAKKAQDLAVLVEALQEEFSAELAALREDVDDLDRRVTDVEDRVVRLQERQTKTEEDVAELKAIHEKFTVGGTFETSLEDVSVSGSATDTYVDPYTKDYDDDNLDWVNDNDSDDVYEQGATLESALTLKMAMKPAEGIDATAKLKVKDAFTGSDYAPTNFSLADLAVEITSDGTVERAYYGNLSSKDAFAGYSRFIKTPYELVNDKKVNSLEGAQVDVAKGDFNGQFAALGTKADDDYFLMSRGEYTLNPNFTVGAAFTKTATSTSTEDPGLQRYGAYAKGALVGFDYNLGFYNNDADQSALELALARNFGIVDVTVDHTSDYADDTYTMFGAETVEGFTLGAFPVSVYGEFGTTDAAAENHTKFGFKVEEYEVGFLNLGAGFEMVSKATDAENVYEVPVWDDSDDDYSKVSFNAGFDFNVAAVEFIPSVEWYTKDVTDNPAGIERKDNRTTFKLGFETSALTKGTLEGAFKRVVDKTDGVESNANGLEVDFAYPVGSVDLTVGGEWLDYDETVGSNLGDYSYVLVKSGVSFDF